MTISAATILHGLIYLMIMVAIVTGKSDTATSRFFLLPRSKGDALALAFHTLELIVANGLFLCMYGVILLHDMMMIIILATGISSIILVVMSLASWRRDRSLSKTGLIFGAPVTMLFLIFIKAIV